MLRRSSILFVVAGLVAACGGSASTAPASAGTAPTSVASSAGSAPPASVPVATTAAGGASTLCGIFTTAEISTLLGKAVAGDGTANQLGCTWAAADGTKVVVEKTTETEICDAEQAGIEAAGKGIFDGDRWAGLSVTGETAAGVIIGDTCYDIRIGKTTPAPKPADVLAFLKQLTDRAGA